MLELLPMNEVTIDRYKLRMLRGDMDQKELARLSGVSQPHISRMELGQKRNARLSTLSKLAKALNVPVIDLIEGVAMRSATTGAASITREAIKAAVDRALGGQSTLSQQAIDRIVIEIVREEIKKASEATGHRDD